MVWHFTDKTINQLIEKLAHKSPMKVSLRLLTFVSEIESFISLTQHNFHHHHDPNIIRDALYYK